MHIHGIDDSGRRAGPLTLDLGAEATAHFNSRDLEQGNPAKGLSGRSLGDGEGDWRLELTSELDIVPLAYLRTSDGFLTSMHDVVRAEYVRGDNPGVSDRMVHRVGFFNPGSNRDKVSRLRVINTAGIDNTVTINGVDDRGNPGEGEVRITLPAYGAGTVTAEELESGVPSSTTILPLEGRLGDRAGKWQLIVSAESPPHRRGERPIQVMSLLWSPQSENLTNLSAVGDGNDSNRGGDGTDWIWGGAGDDILNPGDNDDWYDSIYGSAGNDTIVYTDSGPTAFQWLGYFGLETGIRATINGITNVGRVDKGTSGNDVIVDIENPLNAARNTPPGAFGMGGTPFDDRFDLTLADGQWMDVRGEAGNDTINIVSGRVKVNYRHSPNGVDVDLGAGRAYDGYGGVDTIIGDVYELEGGLGDDTLLGTDGRDRLGGGPGNDTINPGNNDWQESGSDSIFASTGNDTIDYSDSVGPRASQSLYYDPPWRGTTFGEPIRATVDGARNYATIDKGSAGTDTILDVEKALGNFHGGFNLDGTHLNDVFDLMLDHGQWMMVEGGAGNDTFNLRTQRWESESRPGSTIRIDYRNSEKGIDIDLRAGEARDDGFGDVDTFTFNDGYFQIRGSNLSDTIRGSDNDDDFIGRRGDDVIDGRGGYDGLRFNRSGVGAVEVDLSDGTAKGTWDGEPFSYRISNIERVRGSNSGDDRLFGSNGDDRLEGYGGDDVLEGRGGNDRLSGGDGDDTFFFGRGHGHDRIDDFADGEDVIVLIDLGIGSKQEVLRHAYAWEEGIGVHIDLTGFGGGRIDLHGFRRDLFDASDFRL